MKSVPISFKDIFLYTIDDMEVNSIEIPIIQRDYAQGRINEDVNRIRSQFVDMLYKALTKNEFVKLDFIYGNIENGKLIPLDGQQRLTTIFLLHWYIAKKESIALEEQEFLSKFTYKTRFSSQHFCKELVKSSPDFSLEKISSWIKDQNWFMYSWENDPTIKGMLVMLDAIHCKFNSEINLWNKLMDKNNSPISFYFLALDKMGLTDSLYIKMNSRGKPLTNFEHFKADFEETIKEVSIDLYNEFIKKVDVDWVDIFWDKESNEVIDDKFMRLYRFITEMICYKKDINIVANDFDLANSVYSTSNPSAIENLKELFGVLDNWKSIKNIDVFFKKLFAKQDYVKQKIVLHSENLNLFSLCCNQYGDFSGKRRTFSLINTFLLHAIHIYILNKDFLLFEDFIKRLRVVRNLAQNSQDETRETRLPNLLKDVESIILTGQIIDNNLGFSVVQKEQEQTKISWRKDNPTLVDILDELEDHRLLQGNIAIIGTEDVDNFETYATNFIDLFSKENSFVDISRALLVTGDYSQSISWRFSLGNTNDSNWKDLFTISVKRKGFENTKNVILKFLNNSITDMKSHIKNTIQDYLHNENTLKDWRFYFVKYPLMRSGNSGMYFWYNDDTNSRRKINQYDIFMMNTPQKLGGRHWNPFHYVLYKNPDFEKELSLNDYGDDIYINNKNQYLSSSNNSWNIYTEDRELVKVIKIKQNLGNDVNDRIEIISDFLKSYLWLD